MLKEEFTIMTGIYPSQDLYNTIEKHYNASDVQKDVFCDAYKKNLDGLAVRIQRETDEDACRREEANQELVVSKAAEIAILEGHIARLQEDLDREQEWNPHGILSEMSQGEYEVLLSNEKETMTAEAVKNWIEEDFGFSKDRIEIITEIYTYLINRHNAIRRDTQITRRPVYNTTDWNYALFACGGWKYEVVNGQIYRYED